MSTAEALSREGVLSRFGDYELLSEIARGGMGVVYCARQISLNRLVAVKLILSGQLATNASRERFRTEAQAAGRLHHPGIVRIYEIGEVETQPFYSMELIDGGSLADCLQEFQLNPRSTHAEHRSQELCIAELISSVARALHFAHQHGVLHRDLKPSNILIDSEGQPHLTDFGLAKLIDTEKSRASLSNTVLGSPGYVAPEQASGRGEVTIAADVYGLGACLYELLTGRPPFVGANAMDTLLQAIHSEPLPAGQLNPRLHQDLETIAGRCLEREPAKRYSSAALIADELDRFCRGEPIHARPISNTELLWRWCCRNPGTSILLAAFLVSVLIGISTVLWQWKRAELANERLSESVHHLQWITIDDTFRSGQASRALAGVASLLRKDPSDWKAAMFGKSIMDYTSFPVPASPAIIHNREFTVARLSPDGTLITTASIDGTARLWDSLTSEPRSPSLQHGGTVNWAEFSPDGKLLATCAADKTVRIWDVATGTERTKPIPHREGVQKVHFSSDGQFLLTVTRKSVAVFSVVSGEPKLGPIQREGEIVSARFVATTDSQLMLFAAERKGDTSRLLMWNVLTGQSQLDLATGPLEHADISNDLTMAATSNSDQLILWDLNRRERRFNIQSPDGRFGDIRFSPDGRRLAVIGLNQWVRIWSTENGLPLTPELPHYFLLEGVQFFDGGSQLLTWGYDSLAQIWKTESGERLAEPLVHSSRVIHAESGHIGGQEVFLTTVSHQKSREIHTRPGAVQLWRIRRRSVPREFSSEPPSTTHDGNAVSRDGKWLAFGRTSQEVFVVDTRTGQRVCDPLKVIGAPWGVMFNPKQDRLAIATASGQISVWSLPDGRTVGDPVKLNTTYQPIDTSGDGKHFVTGSTDGYVRIWEMESGRAIREMKHGSEINSVAFSANGQWVASAGEDHRTCVWESSTGRLIHALEGHSSEVMRVAFTPNGRRLVTACLDKTARLWEATSGKLIAILPHRGEVIDAASSPDSRWIATASRDRTAMIWDAETGRPKVRSLLHEQAVRNVQFSPDSQRLLTRDFRGLRLWDVGDGTPLTIHLQQSVQGGTGFQSKSTTPVFTPDGKSLFVANDSEKAWLWHLPVPPAEMPNWLPDLMEAVAGQRFIGEDDVIEAVPPAAFEELRARIMQLENDDFWTTWAKSWLQNE